jgi:hypothetical protein
MAKEFHVVHHAEADRRTDVVMPYAPAIVVRRGALVFLSGVTAAPVYHHHPHREEDFDLPPTMREQAVRALENLRRTLDAAGCTIGDLVSARLRTPPEGLRRSSLPARMNAAAQISTSARAARCGSSRNARSRASGARSPRGPLLRR